MLRDFKIIKSIQINGKRIKQSREKTKKWAIVFIRVSLQNAI